MAKQQTREYRHSTRAKADFQFSAGTQILGIGRFFKINF